MIDVDIDGKFWAPKKQKIAFWFVFKSKGPDFLLFFFTIPTLFYVSLSHGSYSRIIFFAIPSSKEGALAFFRKNQRKYLRKYLRYFQDCAQNIVNNCGFLCNAFNFVFWSVNLSANIYDISRIALKIAKIFAVYCAMLFCLFFGVQNFAEIFTMFLTLRLKYCIYFRFFLHCISL